MSKRYKKKTILVEQYQRHEIAKEIHKRVEFVKLRGVSDEEIIIGLISEIAKWKHMYINGH